MLEMFLTGFLVENIRNFNTYVLARWRSLAYKYIKINSVVECL